MWRLQVTRIDGTIDSPPCLKVSHKTFGSQNSNADMVFCRLSMPIEFHPVFKSSPIVDVNGIHEEDVLKVKHRYSSSQLTHGRLICRPETNNIVSSRYPLRSVRHSDESRRVDYSSITTVTVQIQLV